MRKVFLIRHALPGFPGGERMCLGTTDIPLGPEGLVQAARLARHLPTVSAVFSSPLSRAIQTAQALGQEITVIPGLREYHMGQWDGLTFRQIRQLYPQLYAARGTDPSLPMPGEEDRQTRLHRFQAAMAEAAAQSSGDIAVVTHGGVIAAFLDALGSKAGKPGYAQFIQLTCDGEFRLWEDRFYP